MRRGWGQEGQPGDTVVARTRVRQEWGGEKEVDSRATKEIGSAGLVKGWLWWEGAGGGEHNDEVTQGNISAG